MKYGERKTGDEEERTHWKETTRAAVVRSPKADLYPARGCGGGGRVFGGR